MSNALAETHAGPQRGSRQDTGRDVLAAVLLAVALLLPWNLEFGLGIPGSAGWLFAVVIIATLSAWAGLAAGHVGGRGASPQTAPSRLRLFAAAPYLLVVAGFVAHALVAAVRLGGSGDVPPGVGPGLLAGLAGAVLVALTPAGVAAAESNPGPWVTRVIGVSAAVLAVLAVLANLYWRARFPVQTLFAGEYVGQNLAVVATTVVYGGVALVAVLVGLRWLLRDEDSARWATVALGVATLLGTTFVWVFGVGRDIDAFHGIAQTTSTAKVGFEGYVAWVAAAALAAPWLMRAHRPGLSAGWRDAVRKCLGLIGIWCAGSALLRIFDLIVAVSLDMPFSPYDSVALLAFDIVAGAAAMWLRVNFTGSAQGPALPTAVLSAAAGVLAVLMVCRVAVGVGLAPRILYSSAPADLDDSVYGNMLAQQITSTFDVVLCWVAIIVAAAAVAMSRRARPAPVRSQAQAPAASPEPATQHLSAPGDQAWAAPTEAHAAPAGPKIVRAAAPTVTARSPRITRVLEESTQRFGAGTTYTGTGPARRPEDG